MRPADVVLWRPAYFGVQPELILKAGHFAWGSLGNAPASLSVTVVSQAALDDGVARKIGSRRRFAPARGTRWLRRADLIAGRACPQIDVDLADGTVSLNGRVLAASPVATVPASRRYLLA